MKHLKMTTKRQVTFPVEVCEALGLAPGDEVALESHACQGGPVWVLRPARPRDRRWLYALRRYAEGKEHSLEAIRESISARKEGAAAATEGGRS
jgi:bifunctional DNA-binding transcriptional regulator/antitoxin component of YhaV-PrlF toxin-antitoxin module